MEISTRLILKILFFKVWTCLHSMCTFWNLCATYECDSAIVFRLLVTRCFILIWLVFYLWVIPDASCCISKRFLDSLLLNKKSGNASESQMLNMRIFMNNCLDPVLTQGCHIYLYILFICLPVCLSLYQHCVYIISVSWKKTPHTHTHTHFCPQEVSLEAHLFSIEF